MNGSMNFGGGPLLIFVVIALIVIAGVIYSWLQTKKRREAMAAWAAQNGLSYSPGHDGSFQHSFPEFSLLKSGEGDRYAYNIMAGTYRKRELRAFDYHYITTSTDDKGNRTTHHHNFSAIIVGAELPLKPLNIRPEGFFDKIGAAFGFEDINFESAEFSRKYKVTAPDRKWAYDILHQRAIEFLLAQPKFSLAFGNRNLVMFWTAGCWEPAQFELAANTVGQLLDLIPVYVREQQQGVAS